MLKAPFPWFGGKSRVAHLVWERFGQVDNYVEPFFGSGAVLLGRPDWQPGMVETVNDKDALLCNFWRSVKRLPLTTAYYADELPIENDLHAKNYQLAIQRGDVRALLEGDPEWCDPKLAGWWGWGICLWIGAEFATLCGPWTVVDGRLVKGRPKTGVYRGRPDCSFPCGIHSNGVKRQLPDSRPKGVWRKRPELGSGTGKGMQSADPTKVAIGTPTEGVTRKLPNLSSWSNKGVDRQRPALGTAGAGVQKRLPHLSSNGQGIHRLARLHNLQAWFGDLYHRMERVRVCSGDWKRVLGPSVTTKHGITGLFLDPPYKPEGRDKRCYNHDDGVWDEVWPRALEMGQDPLLRIALCGYDGDHGGELVAAGWDEVAWTAQGGYGGGMGARGDENRKRERIWFSPACLKPGRPVQQTLFSEVTV